MPPDPKWPASTCEICGQRIYTTWRISEGKRWIVRMCGMCYVEAIELKNRLGPWPDQKGKK